MKKFTLLLSAMLFSVMSFAQGVMFTQTFPGNPSEYTGSYSKSFTVTTDGYTLTYANINNGQANDNWTAVRAGSKNGESVATITSNKIAGAVSKVVVNFTEVKADKTNALYLEVASTEDFANAAKVEATIAQGEVEFAVAAPAVNQYYRVTIDQAKGSANGFNRFDKVMFYGEDGNTTPDDGGDDVTPDDGGDDVTPDDGGDDVTPDDGGDDVTPDDGGNTTPDDGDDTTPDDGGDDTPLTSAPATMAAGDNATACTVNGADGIKVGSSKNKGTMTITVPAGAKTLSFYAAAWNKVPDLSVSITPAENINPASITLTADEGIQGSATDFTLTGDESGYLFKFNLKDITKSTTFTLTAPKRFVVWNATYSADGTAGDDTPDDGGTTPDTPKGDEVKVSGLVYADAIYYEYDGVGYYDIDMYKDMDSETYEYTYPEVYVSIPAKSKTALNGTYDVLYAGYWSSANDSVEIDEETYGTITIKNTDNEGNYSVQGSFVGTDGKTYTFNDVVNVWAFDYDTFEEIVLNETGSTDTPDTPGTDNPVAGTVTFDADVDKGNAGTDHNNPAAYQVSKDGVTMEVSSGILGTYNNEMHYRIYKNQTLTITSTVGNIVSVEFTCTANDDEKYGPGCWTVDGGDYDYAGAVGTWTGNASSVVFTAATNQVRATQIVVKLGGTAVEDLLVGETPVKMIKNGQLMIIRGENTYNVLGAQMK